MQFLKTSNLYSLQTRVPSNIKERAVYLAGLPSLKKVIMSASNLRLLNVNVQFGDLLHSVSAETPRVFQFEKGDQLPLLEELKLYCDSFSIENWTVWFACIDWTRIRRLDFDTAYHAFFIKYFHGRLPALRAFKTGIHTSQELMELDRFLTTLDQLEELDICTFGSKVCFPKKALARHGTCSLRHIGYLSSLTEIFRRFQFSSVDQLYELNKQCTKLESLEIDVQFLLDWPFDIFSSLARFTRLHYLKVRCDISPLPIADWDLRKGITTTKRIFNVITREKIGVPLLTMDLITRLNLTRSSIGGECSRDKSRPILATIRCQATHLDDGRVLVHVQSWDDCIERHAISIG